MRHNGFIASSLLYGMLALFLVIMLSTLAIFANNKLSMDRLREKANESAGEDGTPPSNKTLEYLGITDIENIPSEPDINNPSQNGLYRDSTEENRYIYRGDSESNTDSNKYPVNNYICLDENTTGECSNLNFLYRIISIEQDGTIKVIKYTNIGVLIFDAGYNSKIDGLKPAGTISGTRYSNNSKDYCYSSDKTNYNGCNFWGSKSTIYPEINSSTPPSEPAYLNAYLNGDTYITRKETGVFEQLYGHEYSDNNKIKSSIVPHKFNVGGISSNSTSSLDDNVRSEKEYNWDGLIGLITATEYVKASTNNSCKSVSGTNCNNWLHFMNQNGEYNNIWTLTATNNKARTYYIKGSSGDLVASYVKTGAAVHPVFYLKPNLKFTQATGKKNNPYRIESN